MKNILLAACLPFLAAAARASGSAEADRLFDRGLYQEALKLYEGLYSGGSGDVRWKALFRACESEALLFRYGEAVERLKKAALPGESPWRERLLLLKAELYREYLRQYGGGGEDVIEGEREVFRRPGSELKAEVDAAYRDLWGAREALASRPIGEESYFFDVAKADLGRYPALLDFLVLSWGSWLLEEGGKRASDPMALLKDECGLRVDSDASAALQAAALYEAAARMGPGFRAEAAEHWRIERLMLPFRQGHLFEPFRAPGAAADSAAAVLTKWSEKFQNPSAKALASYEAAALLRGRSRYEEALEICGRADREWPKTYGAGACRTLVAQIRAPELVISARTVPPPGKDALALSCRNLRQAHFRLYSVDPERLLGEKGREAAGWSGALNWADDDWIKGLLAGQSPARSWSVPVKFRDIHESSSQSVDLPDAGPGLYFAAACSEEGCEPGSNLVSGVFVNVTEAVLFGSAGIAGPESELVYRPEGPSEGVRDAFWFYAMDGKSGRPLEGADIALFLGSNGNYQRRDLKTDALGRSAVPVSISLKPGTGVSFQADPLLRWRESAAYWAHPLSVGFSPDPFLKVFTETDRPIYRPGQKVAYKAVVLQRVPRGYQAYARPGSVKIKLIDPNGQEAASAEKKPGPFGSVSGEFLIPTGRLLGSWSLSASVEEEGGPYSGSSEISVEEYKRPEFEVTLAEAKGAWRFGREARVEGEVKYYFGGPVANAELSYVVTREAYVPWFCWWWSWRRGSGGTEVLRSQARTGPDGRFSFSFVPDAAGESFPARFQVRVEAREAGGRTITAEKSYLAGASAYLFSITPASAFLTGGSPMKAAARLLNLNGAGVAGKGSWALFKLEKEPSAREPAGSWSGFPQSPSLEEVFGGVPDGAEVLRGDLSFSESGETSFPVQAVAPGAYRLTLRADDPWGGTVRQSIILLCVDPKTKSLPVKLSAVSLPERSEYSPGETARVLLGSSGLAGTVHVEVWGGDKLLSRHALPGGVRLFELPIRDEHKGGATVRWFGVSGFKPRAGSLTFGVPWREKALSLKLRHDGVLRPGQKASWSVSAQDGRGRPADAEASLRMYDRSLEYYASSDGPDFQSLFARRGQPSSAAGSWLERSGYCLPVVKGWIRALLSRFSQRTAEPFPPGLRINRSRVRGGFFPRRKSMAMLEMADRLDMDAGAGGAARNEERAVPAAAPVEAQKAKAPEEKRSEPAVQARKDFSETAFFLPRLRLRSGRADFSFAAPERLTGWRIGGYALTRDAKSGTVAAETVTRKDLMVRVEIPRFLREGDEAELKAVVHNETDSEVSAAVSLSVLDGEDPASEAFGLDREKMALSIAPHNCAERSWKVRAPRALKAFKVRAVAGAGELSDAEERDLPVLPARTRLIDSIVEVLDGDAVRKLGLKSLETRDESRVDELLQLQIDPQLALAVLNSIPFLVHYPYECVEQTLNRFVPLAIVGAVYSKHPALARAASKIPKRKTLTPAWDAVDAKRMTELIETPWLRESRGVESRWPVVDLLDPEVAARERKDALERLQSVQNQDGGWPWFPGGRSDPYMTLLVLAGLSEAQRYGVEAPADLLEKGLGYAMSEVPRHLKPEEGEVSLLLYAAYVVTSFPARLRALPAALRAADFAKAWLAFAARHSDAMTQIGKAYAAQAYFRLGDKPKAALFMDRAMDGLREDPVSGAYWQPEKYSWLWYHDTLESHAFMLRTLQLMRPKDRRIPGLVRWLLFNRKASEWKSTKASAAAVFALLDVLKSRGALDRGEEFTVSWGPEKFSASVGPEDWLDKPLRWNGKAAAGSPEVGKRGPGIAFASLTRVYTTEEAASESEPGLINVRRTFYRRHREGGKTRLSPLKSGETVRVGDEIEVQLKVNARSQFEYVQLKDPRGAGFEAEELLSGWKWDMLGRYEEPRDSLTNFFVSWLPHGEYVLSYRVRPATPGRYRIGPAVLQSMYSPEFAAHSSGIELTVAR